MNMRVEETYQMNVAVKVRVQGRGEKKGDSDKGKQPEKRRPDHTALLVPIK